LSKLALELQVNNIITKHDVDSALAILAESEAGKTWLEAWEKAKYPWFNFTTGNGFYSTDKYWIEHLEIPFGYIQDYVIRLEKGKLSTVRQKPLRQKENALPKNTEILLQAKMLKQLLMANLVWRV
jgi:hypothetical protein